MADFYHKITIPLIAGSAAGVVTDIVLYPIDTIKTRLQSSEGFYKSGGFSGIYKGIGAAAAGSAPAGASFFFGYELTKYLLQPYIDSKVQLHMVSACLGEVFSCVFRIPFEVVKQNAQALPDSSSASVFYNVWKTQGPRGLFRGFNSMVFRDVPFILVQMPIWEFLKAQVKLKYGNVSGFHSGLCGSIAGGISAAVTTPFDVVKTRVILNQDAVGAPSEGLFKMMFKIWREEGLKTLFSGVTPRVMWISLGGFVFLGSYDQVKIIMETFA